MKNIKKYTGPGSAIALTLICLTINAPAKVFAEVLQITAGRDVTLIEDEQGDTANGSGPVFFAGRTNQPEYGIRRALLYFDVAAVLPKEAVIDFANVILYQKSNNPDAVEVSLHRLLADWGEGVSSSSGGRGRPAGEGDSTWLFRHWPSDRWQQHGGEFMVSPSAVLTVSDQGSYSWPGTSYLINDVRLWQQQPRQNFGWLVRGDEENRGTIKRFGSRESNDTGRRPVLTIRYHLPGE